ncbi:MAG: hypothetical protein ACM32O_21210 [Clostridia bacterium]
MKKWKNSEEVIESFKKTTTKGCETIECGVLEIDPRKIIALDLDYNDIKDDYKMKELKESVKKNGWTNQNPQTLCLLEFPNGEYVVNGGGNHRAVLSNELGLKGIQATVMRVIYLPD